MCSFIILDYSERGRIQASPKALVLRVQRGHGCFRVRGMKNHRLSPRQSSGGSVTFGERPFDSSLESFSCASYFNETLLLKLVLDTAPELPLTSVGFGGGNFMKSLRFAALTPLAVLWAISVHASTIPASDPRIKLGGGDPSSHRSIFSALLHPVPNGTIHFASGRTL